MKESRETRQIALDIKIARVIAEYSRAYGVSPEEAADAYYRSLTSEMIEEGVADLHCRSNGYLAEELWLELHKLETDGSAGPGRTPNPVSRKAP